jgi:hypothetical protein
MVKRVVVIFAGMALLSGEAIGEIGKVGLYWIMPDHSHVEIPEGNVASAYSRPIVDSGVTATAATSTIDLLNGLGYSVPIIVRR